MYDRLSTPFGDLSITLNKIQIEYNYSVEKMYIKDENKEVDVYLIDIDLSNYEINDIIECRIKDIELSYNDGDERCDLLSVENNGIILGICGYEPQYHESERELHCYELDEFMSGKFEYKIYRNPKNYLDKFKESYIINIKVCWLNKNEFKDPDTTLFLALC